MTTTTMFHIYDPLFEMDNLKFDNTHTLKLQNANIIKAMVHFYIKGTAQSAQPPQYRQQHRLYTRRLQGSADANTDD